MRSLAIALLGTGLALGGCLHDEDDEKEIAPAVLAALIVTPAADLAIVAGQSVNFTGTTANGSAPFTYLWTFGGGSPDAIVEDPGNVTFPAVGVYLVTFRVTDAGGSFSTDTVTVTVQPILATIDAPAGNVTIAQGASVNFQATVQGGTPGFTHAWNYSGGATASAVEDPGLVAFSTPGVYLVTYTVTDSLAAGDSDTVTVTVQPIVATISSPAGNVTINTGDSLNFQAGVSGGTPGFTHAWDFSGGATASALEDPGLVAFPTSGVYLVTYSVTDALGASDSDSLTVTVLDNGAPYTKTQVKNRWAALQPLGGAFSYSATPVVAVDDTGYEGAVTQQLINDGINLTNFYRWLAGLPDAVTENATFKVSTQKGAHVLVALRTLGQPIPDPHNPPVPTGASANYTANIYVPGEDACGRSNVFRGSGPSPFKPDGCVHGYMDDFGNASTLGHRRWILHPRLNTTAFGTVWFNNNWASLMYVFDTTAPAPTFDFVAYPSEGYYPKQLFLDPADGERVLWSFSANSALYGLGSASVTVTRRSNGSSIPVTTSLLPNGFGISPTISFNPGESTQGETYDVTVSNITVLAGGTTSYSYWVEFFDITAP